MQAVKVAKPVRPLMIFIISYVNQKVNKKILSESGEAHATLWYKKSLEYVIKSTTYKIAPYVNLHLRLIGSYTIWSKS